MLFKFKTRPSIFIITLLLCSLFSFAQSKDEKAILDVMKLEEKYWNEGNIEGYVSLYAPEDSVRMIWTTGATYGRDSILAFYKKYWPKERMGQLKLDGIRLERLSKKYYFTSGFFHVTYPDRKAVNGRFSGLMKKIKGKWYLYTDHSG
ncbi:MAG: nuclear transport factor 2 family protein [Chitinophagaceae bacterium]